MVQLYIYLDRAQASAIPSPCWQLLPGGSSVPLLRLRGASREEGVAGSALVAVPLEAPTLSAKPFASSTTCSCRERPTVSV